MALENLGLELQNRYERLELDGDASREKEWRKNAPSRLGIVLVQQTHLAGIQRLPNHRGQKRQTTKVLRRNTRKPYQRLKSIIRRPTKFGEVLVEKVGSIIPCQARRCWWERHFKELVNPAASLNTTFSQSGTPATKQYPREVYPPSLYKICAATYSCATTETLERMTSQLRFKRCALAHWARGCIGLLTKSGRYFSPLF